MMPLTESDGHRRRKKADRKLAYGDRALEALQRWQRESSEEEHALPEIAR